MPTIQIYPSTGYAIGITNRFVNKLPNDPGNDIRDLARIVVSERKIDSDLAIEFCQEIARHFRLPSVPELMFPTNSDEVFCDGLFDKDPAYLLFKTEDVFNMEMKPEFAKMSENYNVNIKHIQFSCL